MLVQAATREALCAANEDDFGLFELIEHLRSMYPREPDDTIRESAEHAMRAMLRQGWLRLTRTTVRGDRSEPITEPDGDALDEPASWSAPGPEAAWYLSFEITFDGEVAHARPGFEHSATCIGVWEPA